MAWLSGWNKRVKLTIDSGDIDAALSDFPILVYISASSGINSEDISFVFDELTQDANRKKIAVTLGEDTECYVEIEKWDDANEKAWLWIKVPTIASGSNTDLYLYYDSSHADNDAYVGDTNDAVAENVWDDATDLVWLGKDGVDNQHVYDSTTNDREGIEGAAGEPTEETATRGGYGADFDGGDWIDFGNSYSPLTNFTVEFYGHINATAVDKQIISKGYDGSNTQWELKTTQATGEVSFRAWNGSSLGVESTNQLAAGANTYLAGKYSTTTWYINWNGIAHVSNVNDGPPSTNMKLEVGSVDINGNPGQFWDGSIYFIRISSGVRADAWCKATNETCIDHLLDWGSEEILSAYYHGLKVQSVGELALCDVGTNPLRVRKGGTTYGVELVDTSDPNASAVRIKTSSGIKAIRKYT